MDAITKRHSHLMRRGGDLCAFILVANFGSFAQAARALGVSQPSLSKRVRNLEGALKEPLLQRTHAGVIPTAAGERLLASVRGPIDQAARGLDFELDRKKRDDVLVSVDYAFASYWLLPRLPQLREEAATGEIRILASQQPLLETVASPDIFIFMGTTGGVPSQSNLLFPERVSAVASPALLKEIGPLKAAAELAQRPDLLLHLASVGPETPWLRWDDWLSHRAHGLRPVAREMVFNTYEMVIRAATDGQGIALGWHGLVDDLLESGRLELVFPDAISTTNGYFLRAAQTPPAPQVRRMCDWIVSSAAGK